MVCEYIPPLLGFEPQATQCLVPAQSCLTDSKILMEDSILCLTPVVAYVCMSFKLNVKIWFMELVLLNLHCVHTCTTMHISVQTYSCMYVRTCMHVDVLV